MSYRQSLGVVVERAGNDGARLRIPYKDENSNPGRALHGGVAASAIDIAGALAARGDADVGPDLEAGVVDVTVDYLAAAIGEDIVAEARVLRRGKELTYAAVDVRTDAGKAIATGLVTHRRAPRSATERVRSFVAPPAMPADGDVPEMARMLVRLPFIGRLGMRIAHMRDGAAVLEMPFQPSNADADGAVHEGAAVALLDTAASMAAWSLVGLDLRVKASTVGLHASFHRRAPGEDLVAHSRLLHRQDEIFLTQVTLAGRAVVATAAVTYRIVVPA